MKKLKPIEWNMAKNGRKYAAFAITIIVLGLIITVLTGFVESWFVFGERNPSASYSGWPIAWSGTSIESIDDFSDGFALMIKYYMYLIGFIVDWLFIMAVIFTLMLIAAFRSIKKVEK
jgi:hypothetical protein